MSDIKGLPPRQLAKHADQAAKLIKQYDRDRDGKLDQSERTIGLGRHTTRSSERNGDYVTYTETTYDRMRAIHDGRAKAADKNGDGVLERDELVGGWLAARDRNGNGVLSLWERILMFFKRLPGHYEQDHDTFVGSHSWSVFEPAPPEPATPEPAMPAPPSWEPEPSRPEPPSWDPEPLRPAPPEF